MQYADIDEEERAKIPNPINKKLSAISNKDVMTIVNFFPGEGDLKSAKPWRAAQLKDAAMNHHTKSVLNWDNRVLLFSDVVNHGKLTIYAPDPKTGEDLNDVEPVMPSVLMGRSVQGAIAVPGGFEKGVDKSVVEKLKAYPEGTAVVLCDHGGRARISYSFTDHVLYSWVKQAIADPENKAPSLPEKLKGWAEFLELCVEKNFSVLSSGCVVGNQEHGRAFALVVYLLTGVRLFCQEGVTANRVHVEAVVGQEKADTTCIREEGGAKVKLVLRSNVKGDDGNYRTSKFTHSPVYQAAFEACMAWDMLPPTKWTEDLKEGLAHIYDVFTKQRLIGLEFTELPEKADLLNNGNYPHLIGTELSVLISVVFHKAAITKEDIEKVPEQLQEVLKGEGTLKDLAIWVNVAMQEKLTVQKEADEDYDSEDDEEEIPRSWGAWAPNARWIERVVVARGTGIKTPFHHSVFVEGTGVGFYKENLLVGSSLFSVADCNVEEIKEFFKKHGVDFDKIES